MPHIFNVTNLENGKKQLDITKAIIDSMTILERKNPNIINGSRKVRIANGSGTSVQTVNKLLKQFNQMKDFMKKYNNTKTKFKLPFLK